MCHNARGIVVVVVVVVAKLHGFGQVVVFFN